MYTLDRIRAVLAAYAVRQQSRAAAGEIAPVTASNCAHHCRRLAGGLAGHALVADAQAYVDARLAAGVAPQSVRIDLSTLAAACSWAGREWLGDDPPPRQALVRLAPRGLPRRPRRRLTDAEVDRLLATAHPRWRGLWALLIGTGLRPAAARALRWRGVDEERGTLTIERGKAGPYVTILPPGVAALLPRRGAPDEYLFPGRDRGSHVSHSATLAALRRDCDAAGIDRRGVSPHALRHTATSRWLEAGATVRELQELGGWRTAAVPLQVYAHADPGRLADVAHRAFRGPAPA